MTAPAAPRRRLILLGSTGSIGVSTLEVIKHLAATNHAHFEVVGLATGSNSAMLAEQARGLRVKHVAVADPNAGEALSEFAHVYTGPDAALQLVQEMARPGDLLVGAMVGSAGVPATLAAIDRGCDIALANKETLVAAGELVMPRVKASGVTLLPIDSEHSAIFQCLLAGRSVHEVKRLVITASGGPFRTWSIDCIRRASVEEALNHPTWNMGPKITIDSASMMNKALEIIEAHWLFGLDPDRIEVIVHPQSIVHSFVEFVDNSIIAQLGPPDMRTPIQYALTWPHRAPGCSRTLDWAAFNRLDFERADHDRFPALQLAYDVVRRGGTAGAVFNAANEAAVAAFLARRIPFGRISSLVQDALACVPSSAITSLHDIQTADAAARAYVESCIGEPTMVQTPRPPMKQPSPASR